VVPPLDNARLTSGDIFIDFGVRKSHTVLINRERRVLMVDDLNKLNPENCRIFIEDGCPRNVLYIIARRNQILTVDGQLVKALRAKKGLAKSDYNDVFLIRELAWNDLDSFLEMTAKEKENLLDQMIYAYYCRLTAVIVSLKNHQRSFSVEFGRELPQLWGTLRDLEKEKVRTLEHFEKFGRDVEDIGIKGLGVRYLGGILIRAHPARFHSLSSYLCYCGLKRSARASGKYNRHVASLYNQLASSAIMHKDREFYPLYLKVKGDLDRRFPNYPKYKIDAMARNRTSTFLAKRVYARFNAPRDPSSRSEVSMSNPSRRS
jgi:hypothetical protein